jgi:hypothetical protein
MSTESQAKSTIRLKFFDLIFGDTEGHLCLATTDPRAPKATFAQHFFDWPKESIKMENFILSVERTSNVYFCINLLKKRERRKDFCLHTNLLWADLDSVNPDTIKPPQIPPPIVIASSVGRWQAIWRMNASIDAYQAQDYSRRLAYSLDADKSGWDLTQLLRVPLTVNYKYSPPALVELERISETLAQAEWFEQLESVLPDGSPGLANPPLPISSKSMTSESILYKYSPYLNERFIDAFTYEPDEGSDWSEAFWGVIHRCYRSGMTPEEVFVVAKEAKSNKYQRDGRPIDHLWRDVLKAGEDYKSVTVKSNSELINMPQLVGSPQSSTFLDEYRAWASSATDAIPEFHDISMLIVLSAIVATSVKIETSIGYIVPNLWGLLLGESTVTRKTTAMRMAIDFLMAMDPAMLVANDGSSEGMLQAVSERPNKSSIFHRDEVSGLFDSMMHKDYMSSMQETLTHLYDAPLVYRRRLRKETISIESPSFVMLFGGTPDRVYASIDDSFVYSGFLPRFLVVIGDRDEDSKIKPLGPPKEINLAKRAVIMNKLADLYENYACDVDQKIGGVKMKTSPRYMARLTADAWGANQEFEMMLIRAARTSLLPNLALPTFDRLSKSLLKISVILAATRQKPGEVVSNEPVIIVERDDVLNAAWFIQGIGGNAVNLIVNAGKSLHEKKVEKIFEFVQEHPGISRSDILRRFHLSAKEGELILQTLEQRALVRKEHRGRGYAYWAT